MMEAARDVAPRIPRSRGVAGLHRRRPPVLLAAFAALLATLAGCVTVPSHEVPFALPDTFSESGAGAAAASDRWWEDFNDPQLDRLVETALVRNPALAQAAARARMAEAQTRVRRADQLPQAALAAGSTRQRQTLAGLPFPDDLPGVDAGGVITNRHDVVLDVGWELDLWGRLAALSASARADYLASAEQLRALRQSVAAQVVQMYFEIVQARAQVELSERTVESLAEMARQIDNRVDAGVASPADGMLANANLGSAEAGLAQRREALARGLRQLEVAMGDYPSGSVETAELLPDVPAAPAAGVPAELLARRPDVRAAELGLMSAGYQLGAAQRSFLPSLSLSGSGGYSGSELSDLFRSGNLVWSIAGNILQPLFQGGRLVAQVDTARGQRDELLHAYAETALNALSEVETALAVDRLLRGREQALAASARAAEDAVRVSYNRYQQGIDPFLNVLESQQRALDGRSAQITAHQARLENRIALHLALGGGFEDEPLPVASDAQAPPTSSNGPEG